MIAIRQGRSESWFDRRGGRKCAAELAQRLCARIKGETGVFLTLTYRRDEYEHPRDLYNEASEQRHVRRFMEALGHNLNQSLSGRWLCKLEFQTGGWIHFHIILIGISFIPHRLLADTWGHGFVYIKPLTQKAARYTAKYVCKGGQFPAWIYLMRSRSVKIIRVSPGFWTDTEPVERRDPKDRGSKLHRCGIAIGQCIENASNRCIIQHEGNYYSVNIPYLQLVTTLTQRGATVQPSESSWLMLTAPIQWLHDAAGAQAREAGRDGGHLLERSGKSAEGESLSAWQDPDELPVWVRWGIESICVEPQETHR